VDRFCRRLSAKLETQYSEEMSKSILTGDAAKLLELHTSVRTKLFESFDSQTSGFSSDRVKQCRADLEDKIDKAHQLLKTKNELAALQLQKAEEQQKEQQRRSVSPNRPMRNRPITTTHLPVHPETEEMLQQLAVGTEKLRSRIEELEYSQRQQNRSPPVQAQYQPIVPTYNFAPSIVQPTYTVGSPIQPPPPVVVVVSPSSPPPPQEHVRQSNSSNELQAHHPTRHQRSLSGSNAGNAGKARLAVHSGRVSPVLWNGHRVAQ